jgi:hypothetical protein
MLRYSFTFRNGDLVEELGGFSLDDDAAALTHGKRVIHDLLREGPQLYAGCTIEVSESARSVGIVDAPAAQPLE